MRLAKDHLDVGFSTTDWRAAERFWGDELGLQYEEYLKIGGGVRQHRFGCHGSVVKVNHAREPLPDHPSALQALRLAAPVAEPTLLHEPDGTPVELVPPGHQGVVGLEIAVACPDLATSRRFWVDGVGAGEVGDGRWRVGDTLVRAIVEPGREPQHHRDGRGLRYLTIQVQDCDAEHARLVGLGFAEAMPPTTLGTTARISFVRDLTTEGGSGLFLEISQRASLTGPLPGGAT